MTKHRKVWLWIASAVLAIGCVAFCAVMTALDWDFSKLSTVKYETNEYVLSESFENIRIDTDTANIVFLPSKNGQTKVVCREQEKMKHSVALEDGTLVVQIVDTRKWYDYIGISFGSTKITVYLPKEEYRAISVIANTGDVDCFTSVFEQMKIHTSTGDISIGNLSAGALDLSVSTGKIAVADVICAGDVKIKVSTGDAVISNTTCKNLISDGDTGDMILDNVIVTGRFDIERDTGDVEFYRCDAAEIYVETNTGDVTGSLLSDKVFVVETDTGRVDVPKTVSGGRCEISTDTGNVRITIVNK